ncbi:hypothetical protein P9X10_02355 [Bacillus cereus]|nr:hypothetical protein [Bacillus cereus]
MAWLLIVLDFVTNHQVMQTLFSMKRSKSKTVFVGVDNESETVLYSYLALEDRCNFINPSILCVLSARKHITKEEQMRDGQTLILRYKC